MTQRAIEIELSQEEFNDLMKVSASLDLTLDEAATLAVKEKVKQTLTDLAPSSMAIKKAMNK